MSAAAKRTGRCVECGRADVPLTQKGRVGLHYVQLSGWHKRERCRGVGDLPAHAHDCECLLCRRARAELAS